MKIYQEAVPKQTLGREDPVYNFKMGFFDGSEIPKILVILVFFYRNYLKI